MEIDRGDAMRQLRDSIEDIRFCMMTTVDPATGRLHSRPMTAKLEDDGRLWLLTSDETGKVAELAHDAHVNLSFAEPRDQEYVSVSGTAEVVRDGAVIAGLWNPMYKAWFPDGKDDPHLVALCVEPEQAELWNSSSSTVVQALGFAKAVLTGRRIDGGEHAQLELDGMVPKTGN